jgi:hypothetical protein
MCIRTCSTHIVHSLTVSTIIGTLSNKTFIFSRRAANRPQLAIASFASFVPPARSILIDELLLLHLNIINIYFGTCFIALLI